MPLREFKIGAVGEDVFPRFIARLAEKFDDPKQDRNVVVRDALAQLYLGRAIDHDAILADPDVALATKALVASFDPRNGTLEAEYYREIDLEKWARVKPLLWFWQMFDHSPVGRNVRLGTQMRYMLAQRVFKQVRQGRPHLPRSGVLVRLQPHGRRRRHDPPQRAHRRPGEVLIGRQRLDLGLRQHLLALARRRGHPRRRAAPDGDRRQHAHHLPLRHPRRRPGRQRRDRRVHGRGLQAHRGRLDRRRRARQADRDEERQALTSAPWA